MHVLRASFFFFFFDIVLQSVSSFNRQCVIFLALCFIDVYVAVEFSVKR